VTALHGTTAALRLEHEGPVARLVLARPERRNALDAALIADLTAAVEDLAGRADTRVVVLAGDGPAFCAGADILYMRSMADSDHAANVADARRLAALFRAVRDCPKPVVARVHGAALGGGLGLVAASDIAIAADTTVFGFTEVRLGILPAVIAPFVVPRIGLAAARELFLTGERFGSAHARQIGLVARVVPEGGLDTAVAERVDELLLAGPGAQAAVKRLLAAMEPSAEVSDLAAELIAQARASREGREGLEAFLERRPPGWADSPREEDRP